MSSLLKSYDDFDFQVDKKMVEDSLQLIDDQTRWMEQKLTMKIDNIIFEQFIQCQKEMKELEEKLENWKR